MHKRTLRRQLVGRQPRELQAPIDPSWQILDWQSIGHERAARRVGDWHPTPRRPPARSQPEAGTPSLARTTLPFLDHYEKEKKKSFLASKRLPTTLRFLAGAGSPHADFSALFAPLSPSPTPLLPFSLSLSPPGSTLPPFCASTPPLEAYAGLPSVGRGKEERERTYT